MLSPLALEVPHPSNYCIPSLFKFFVVCELCDMLRSEIEAIKSGKVDPRRVNPAAPPLTDPARTRLSREKQTSALKLVYTQLDYHLKDARERRQLASEAQKSARVVPTNEALFLDGMGYLPSPSFKAFCIHQGS